MWLQQCLFCKVHDVQCDYHGCNNVHSVEYMKYNVVATMSVYDKTKTFDNDFTLDTKVKYDKGGKLSLQVDHIQSISPSCLGVGHLPCPFCWTHKLGTSGVVFHKS